MSESPNDDMRPKSSNDDVRDGWPARFRLFTLRRKAKR